MFFRLSNAAIRNRVNITTVPATGDGSTRRSRCGVAPLPGLRAASAINAKPAIQPRSAIVPKVKEPCSLKCTAYTKSETA